MNDLFAVRAMLEGTAGALASVNLTDAELEKLDALADANLDAAGRAAVQAAVARARALAGDQPA